MEHQKIKNRESDFEDWWHYTGSGIVPIKGHDHEEHAHRIARIAWGEAFNNLLAERKTDD